MSNSILIIGPSGSGKSTAIRTLDPKSTFIINVLDKTLPFKGYKKHYKPISGWDDKEGNYYATDDWSRIIKCIQMVDKLRPDIKTLVIDDLQYVMANEFMKRASENGFSKFTELAQHVWSIFNTLMSTRSDLYSFVLSHSEVDSAGVSKFKTIGKMLDEKITLEGMFTCVLHSKIRDGEFVFMTQNDGFHIAKSPIGMFKDTYIDNDLAQVQEIITDYYEEE